MSAQNPFFPNSTLSISFTDGTICGVYHNKGEYNKNFNHRFTLPDGAYFNVTQYPAVGVQSHAVRLTLNVWHPAIKGCYLPVQMDIQQSEGSNPLKILSVQVENKIIFRFYGDVIFHSLVLPTSQALSLTWKEVESSPVHWMAFFLYYLHDVLSLSEDKGWWKQVKKR